MPDNSEVFAPEQYDGADSSLRNQAPDDKRDQTDVILPGIIQPGRQFRGEMGTHRQQRAATHD